MHADSDRLLIEQIRQGDNQAWDRLIERYEGRLLAFVQRRLTDRSVAEDVVQETFVGFLNSLPNFDATRDLQTYLFTIASHKLTDHLRRLGRHPLQHMPDIQEMLEQQMDRGRGVSSMARSSERRRLESEAICKALRQLLDSWRERGDFNRIQVLELLFVKGWANKDVAALLKIEDQQVANIRFAAVRKLHEQMKLLDLDPGVFPELRESTANA
jgi:RNA polymerase sigma-70 factor (ECF subfamily)